MPKRQPFTEDEDHHLVEFIAKNNPDLPGRSGNKLYQTLVENSKRWPWSKTHPWQSWRERYAKNSVWFDRKIRSYLKKQKAASGPKKVSNEEEATNQAEERVAKRKGSSKAAETDIGERKRTVVHQLPSTSVDDGDPTGDTVIASKITGDASTDSGYASVTKKAPDESEKNPSHTHTTETKLHKRSGGNARVPSSSGYQSTAKPPRPPRQEGDNISQAKESAEEEKRGMPEEPTGEGDYIHELFGSFVEDEAEDVTNPPASSAPTSPTTEITYPNVRNVPPPVIPEERPHVPDSVERTGPSQEPSRPKTGSIHLPSPHPPSSSPPVHRPVGPPQGKKRLLKRKVPEDPFIDSSPTPLSPTPLVTRKVVERNEVPVQNPCLQTRNPVESVWPPTRKRKECEGPQNFTESHTPTTRARIDCKQVKLVASSSKVKLPPSTVHRPDNLIGTELQVSSQVPVPMPEGAAFLKAAIHPYEGTKTSERSRSRAVITEQPPAKRQKLGHPAVTHQESSHRTLALVSTSTPATQQRNHRVNDERPATRHIDLRESLKKRRLSGKSSLRSSRGFAISNNPNHTNRRDSAASSASRRDVSNDGDSELISLFERDLSELGEQYGFALRVVKQTYLQYGTLEKTVVALRALNAIMKGAQDRLYEEMQRLGNNDDTNENDSIPDGLIPRGVSGGKEKGKEVGEREHHGASSNKRHRQSHNYNHLTTDVEDQSEYSPPPKIHANRYTKPQHEGREEEALFAASEGGRFAMHFRNGSQEEGASDGQELPRRATTIRRGLEPSSPLEPVRERSPTSDEEESVPQRETVERHGEEDDDIEMHDGLDVSPDECEARDPTPEVEQVDDDELVLKAEHKRLCSEVTLGNQNILRALEERQDSDLWGKENGDLVTQMFSSLKVAQELRRDSYYQMKARKTEEGEEYEPVADESRLS